MRSNFVGSPFQPSAFDVCMGNYGITERPGVNIRVVADMKKSGRLVGVPCTWTSEVLVAKLGPGRSL